MGAKTRSGTPVETQGAAEGIGGSIQGLFTNPGEQRSWLQGGPTRTPADFGDVMQRISQARGRMGADAASNFLGMDPATLLGGAASQALEDPTSQTASLFQALRPFERRQTEQQVAGLREGFGAAGGRFSRNLMEGESMLRGELANQFQRGRAEQLLSARDRQLQGLGTMLPVLANLQSQGANQDIALLQSLLGFARPGEAVHDPGILPGLLQAGATLGGAALL